MIVGVLRIMKTPLLFFRRDEDPSSSGLVGSRSSDDLGMTDSLKPVACWTCWYLPSRQDILCRSFIIYSKFQFNRLWVCVYIDEIRHVRDLETKECKVILWTIQSNLCSNLDDIVERRMFRSVQGLRMRSKLRLWVPTM